jgi:hypothetical protein
MPNPKGILKPPHGQESASPTIDQHSIFYLIRGLTIMRKALDHLVKIPRSGKMSRFVYLGRNAGKFFRFPG